MKKIFVNEEWCLGCHLCEYNCAFANSTDKEPKYLENDIAKVLKDKKINPNIKIDDDGKICFAVSCRHCFDPQCVKACINGVWTKNADGTVTMDKERCVGCQTCIVACPYGCIVLNDDHTAVKKCELCMNNVIGEPMCVKGCPNNAIIFEEEA
ncbi:MAG: 4Fe-4S binding protein [Oscillospiraceae bacterium]|jgi:carbon-monoxide dehydrogenase iron sulfur subunit|nr:4Fe-4S binding protein [Oscillospiraceae bacterium]